MDRLRELHRLGEVNERSRTPPHWSFSVNKPSGIDLSSVPFLRLGNGSSLYVGDVIQVPQGRGVHPDLKDKWFRVTKIDEQHTISLSLPYHDADCTKPYRPLSTWSQ